MPWCAREPFTGAAYRLACYRGIADLSALTLGTEVVDWRRFATAEAFMGFTGLVPSEYSSGEATRRGHITKAGNRAVRTVLVEAAHAYRHHPAIGATLARRQTRASADTPGAGRCGATRAGAGRMKGRASAILTWPGASPGKRQAVNAPGQVSIRCARRPGGSREFCEGPGPWGGTRG